MIFGMTYKEQEQAFEDKKKRLAEWRPHFCLIPRNLDCGRWAWLHTVETKSEWRESTFMDRYYGFSEWSKSFRKKPEGEKS